MLTNVLIVFVKYPHPGFVKTRLASDIGPEEAALFYRRLVEILMRRTADESYRTIVFYAGENDQCLFSNWLGRSLEMHPQKGEGLGERMRNAFQLVFENGARKAVIIGTDSPLLSRENIRTAFQDLEENACVIGPSRDGGYYLLGLDRPCGELFENIEWSTDQVLKTTLRHAQRLGLDCQTLAESFDIDTLDDALYFKGKVRDLPEEEQCVFKALTSLISKE